MTTVHCSKCGRNFSSVESYQNHLPCHDSSLLGAAGDSETSKFDSENASKEGGTGER